MSSSRKKNEVIAGDRRGRPTDVTIRKQQEELKDGGKCGSRTKGGGLCRKDAGWGTDHLGFGACKLHGGNMPNHVKAAQMHEAAILVEQFGLPNRIDPFDALLEELARTSGHVNWLRLQVGELADEEMHGPVGQSGTSDKGTTHHPQSMPHIWIQMYREERQHLVSVAQACIKAGIEDRKIQFAEEQGVILARVVQGVLAEFDIDPEEAAPVLRKHFAMAVEEANAIEGNGRPVLSAAN